MVKYCTNCGEKLNENAELCLKCGVIVGNNKVKPSNDKKKGLPALAIILIIIGSILVLPIIILLMFFIFAYKTVNSILKNPDIDIWPEEEVITESGTIGDTLISDDFKITLKDALTYDSIGTDEDNINIPEEGNEYLVFFFDIENVSDKSKYITDIDFTGYVDNYEIDSTYLSNDIDGIGDLDVMLRPNKKIRSYIAFEVEESWESFEIRYGKWYDDKELVFTILNEDNSNIQDT